MELKGICPIIATPFTRTGEVDYESLEREVSFMADNGCHGVTCSALPESITSSPTRNPSEWFG